MGKLGRKGLGSINIFSVGIGVVLGIVLSHVFKSTIDGVYNQIPGLNQLKANYGYYY